MNGSMHGNKGNCAEVAKYLQNTFSQFKIIHCPLKSTSKKNVKQLLNKADGFVFLTGTYWESWGSPLQKFLEDFTDLEAEAEFMGKPAVCIVLAHSTGGKSVLSRLQANLNLFGCLIPPMGGVELTLVNQMVQAMASPHKDDLWTIKDLTPMMEILGKYLPPQTIKPWATDKENFRKKWIKT